MQCVCQIAEEDQLGDILSLRDELAWLFGDLTAGQCQNMVE